MPSALLLLLAYSFAACAQESAPVLSSVPVAAAAAAPALRAIHITGWAAGKVGARRELIAKMKEAGLNGVVIALKEYDGRSFVRGAELSEKAGAYVNAIPDLAAAVRDFKAAGLYTVGRIVLFKDDHLPRRRPDLAVKRPDGSLWLNDKGVAWGDPYNREVWEYNLQIAESAAAHFDEIQFDYLRFPSDGPTRQCRYSRQDHGTKTASAALVELLRLARRRLDKRKVKMSICVFGMTTTDDSGLGIGQHLKALVREVDYAAPMMYPSHYSRGQYGLASPNRQPYKTIRYGLADASERLGEVAHRLRPYLQDFSLGHRYGPAEVRAQILAAARSGVTSWTLWNPQNRYNWAGIPRAEIIELTAQAGAKGEPDDNAESPGASRRDDASGRRRLADAQDGRGPAARP